ncbi:universal stress protein YxiE-like isoform X2 [Mytilus trossulus]|uniref:universal stress protein YxiE-like isoform X2 n=1 Tax=Mytilus trossulus TaxID=6551 RepID=UPI0030050B6D
MLRVSVKSRDALKSFELFSGKKESISKQKMEGQSSVEKRVIVVAMDGSTEAESALLWFANNIYKKGDEVVVVHCLHHTAHYTMGFWAPVDAQAVARAFEEESKHATKVCSQLTDLLHKYEIVGKVMQLQGDPGHQIVTTAEECRASFIVVGCRGIGVIRRTVLGSVSDYIVHHSNIPVLVYRH